MYELFVLRLREMLFVEEMLAGEILPRFREHVAAVEPHLLQTEKHAVAVRAMLHRLGADAEPITSPALLGLKAEYDALMEEFPTAQLHAGVLARIEHLEIAAYTELRSTANALGEEEIALRLQEILEQEQYALELTEAARVKLLAASELDAR